MKKLIFALALFTLLLGAAAYSSSAFVKGLQDFFAPIVASKTNLPNTIPAGTIVYETSSATAGFYGLTPDGAWAPLGLASGGGGNQSWSGYHSSGCLWQYSGSSYNDPSDDSTGCSLTERTNTSFGTVSTFGSTKPGITFTPPRIGSVFVCATLSGIQIGAINQEVVYQLTDGSTAIDSQDIFTPNVSGANGMGYSMNLCGIYEITSTSSTTIKIQAKNLAAGTTTLNAGSPDQSIGWSIYYID